MLAEILNSSLGDLLREVKVHVLMRPTIPPPPGRPPRTTNPVQAKREEAILKILQEAQEPLANPEVGALLGDHRGVYYGLRRLIDRGLAMDEGVPPMVRYSAVRSTTRAAASTPLHVGGEDDERTIEARIVRMLSTTTEGMSPAALREALKQDISQPLKTLVERKIIYRRGVGRTTRYLLGDPKRSQPR